MTPALPSDALERIFLNARSVNAFQDKPIDDSVIRELYALLKWGPTSMNAQPARWVFLKSPEAKAKLAPALVNSNVEKTMKAPLTAIVAYDSEFFTYLPQLFKAYDARPMFANNTALAQSTAERNSSLQGAYLIIAARMLGLDAGPMSGFDPEKVNAAFFPEGRYKVNFIVNLGYGDAAGNYPRGERLTFDDVATIV